jgi:hypothetical protein
MLYEKLPVVVGVPDTRPELVLRMVPAGNEPVATE